MALWEASDRICGKRLRVMIPTLLPSLERHGRLKLDQACAYRKSNPDIFVMQSAEDRSAKNTPCPHYGAREGSILVQSQVRARLIIVAGVRFQNPA